MAGQSKSVVKKTAGALSTTDFLKQIDNIGVDGFEGVDEIFQTMPQCKIAGYKSEVVMKGQPGYIEGLEPGMIYNTASKNILTGKNGKAPLVIIGVFHGFTRFGARMGEFRGNYSVDEMKEKVNAGEYVEKTFSTFVTPKTVNIKGEEIPVETCTDTISLFVLSAKHPKDGLMLMSFSSTSFPLGKKWVMKARQVRLPNTQNQYMFAAIWDVGTYLNPNQEYKSPFYTIGDASPDVTQIGLLTDEKYAYLYPHVLQAVDAYKARIATMSDIVVEAQGYSKKIDDNEEDFS
jgi:hypothetical protein